VSGQNKFLMEVNGQNEKKLMVMNYGESTPPPPPPPIPSSYPLSSFLI